MPQSVIRFKDGREATYHSAHNTWSCDDEDLANEINIKNMDLPYRHHGFRHKYHAEAIAATFGAEIVYMDPPQLETLEDDLDDSDDPGESEPQQRS